MYPSVFYNLFPAFPQNDDVFVAMPFAEKFNLRYTHVIKPAIEAAGLRPFRVDSSATGDSIPMKILQGIGQSRLFFADITADAGVRNANVMYELGIAHAVRRPEEVLVFRSDSDSLPFDIAPIFADTYAPDRGLNGSDAAQKYLTASVERAIGEIELTRHLAVQRIVESLDVFSFEFLAQRGIAPFTTPPAPCQLGSIVGNPRLSSGLSTLLTLGVLRTQLPDFIELLENSSDRPTSEKVVYEFTPLGLAVAKEFAHRFYAGRSPAEAFTEFMRLQPPGEPGSAE